MYLYPCIHGWTHTVLTLSQLVWPVLQKILDHRCLIGRLNSFPLDKYSEVGLLDHMGVLFLVFCEHPYCFNNASTKLHSYQQYKMFSLLHILASTCFYNLHNCFYCKLFTLQFIVWLYKQPDPCSFTHFSIHLFLRFFSLWYSGYNCRELCVSSYLFLFPREEFNIMLP